MQKSENREEKGEEKNDKIEGPPGTDVFTVKPNNLAQYLIFDKRYDKIRVRYSRRKNIYK